MGDPVKTSASLQSAMVRLLQETDSADVTLVCEDKEWRLHSAVLEVRSSFFKAAIVNDMKEKREMKIVIKDLDAKTVDEVVKYMHGLPIAGGSVPALLEAAERFQMLDLKEEVARVAVKTISKENVLELGQLAELYNVEQLLESCGKFIVDDSVKLNNEEAEKMPRLTARILQATRKKLEIKSNKLKVERKKLNDETIKRKDAEQNYRCAIKIIQEQGLVIYFQRVLKGREEKKDKERKEKKRREKERKEQERQA